MLTSPDIDTPEGMSLLVSSFEKSTLARALFIFFTHSQGDISGEKNSENRSKHVGRSKRSLALIIAFY